MATARGRWHSGPMRVLNLVLIIVLLATRLAAQSSTTPEALKAGTRVRLSTVDAPSLLRIGTVSAASVDSLWFLPDGADTTVTLPYRAIAQLSVRLARHNNARKGAGIGILVGAGAGIIVGLTTSREDWFTPAQTAVIAGITTGAIG